MIRMPTQPLALAAALTLSASVALAMGARPKLDDEGVNARIQPIAKLSLASTQKGGAAGTRAPEDIYKAICGACHDAGVANAPKLGDKAAWAPRLKAGLDGLTKSAIAGKNAMPPNGGSDASPEELTRVIAFMANKAGANFKAP